MVNIKRKIDIKELETSWQLPACCTSRAASVKIRAVGDQTFHDVVVDLPSLHGIIGSSLKVPWVYAVSFVSIKHLHAPKPSVTQMLLLFHKALTSPHRYCWLS